MDVNYFRVWSDRRRCAAPAAHAGVMFFTLNSMKIAVAIIVLFLVLVGTAFLTKPGCELHGGEWISSNNSCHSPICLMLGNCKPFYTNSMRCKEIKGEIKEKEIIFKLGNPTKVEGDIFYFMPSPTEKDIKAIIENGKVVKLECNVNDEKT